MSTAAKSAYCPLSVSRLRCRQGSRRFPDPAAESFTASRWSTSITPPPRRSRSGDRRDRLTYYEADNANIHRGVHLLSERATEVRGARKTCSTFSTPPTPREIIFVRGATEGINLVAQTYGRAHVRRRRRSARSPPWSTTPTSCPGRCCARKRGARLRVAPINDAGELLLDEFEKLLAPRTKLVAVVARLQRPGHGQSGAADHRDGARARHPGAGRRRAGRAAPASGRAGAGLRLLRLLRAQAVRADRHRRALRQEPQLLEAMPPYQGGGDMISSVTFEKTTYNALPYKFEAGTPDIAGAIGLGAAHRLRRTHRAGTHRRRTSTTCWPTPRNGFHAIPGVRLIGTAQEKAGGALLRAGRRAPARHRHHPRPGRHRHPHRPPLRAAGDGALRRAGHGARLVRALQHRGGSGRAGREGSERCGRCSPDGRTLRDLYQDMILEHSKSPRNFRDLAAGKPQGRGLQPALRRPLHGVPRISRTTRSSDISFQGSGCAISKASASMMTTA